MVSKNRLEHVDLEILDDWLVANSQRYPNLEAMRIRETASRLLAVGASTQDLGTGLETAELAADLNLDTDSQLAALSHRSIRSGRVVPSQLVDVIGTDAVTLLEAVLRMSSTRLLEMSNTNLQTSEARDQVANVRQMLVAMIDDVRVAVVKLAERVVALRRAKNASAARRMRIGRESELVFAPLASRLGIRRLKWELEDLALRYLRPEDYHNIARQLDGRRAEREVRVAMLAESIQERLRIAGLEANVTGRAKNIYSIWRKMQAKNLTLEQVYDVSAVRVLVPDISQCYTTLGIVHTHWQHVPSEFDDYIAVPKDNGYRSIHTAVRDAQGLTLEIQIRTEEMHSEAELGVCAHWVYKDADGANPSGTDIDPYADKMNWLRQVLEWQETVGWSADLRAMLSEQVREERIFVYSPKGHVIDLAQGATPLDFAYRVHTEVGHKCCGVVLDGERVSLNSQLSSGQRVEIITAHDAVPQRRWLDPHLGVVHTARAREKIQAWFREQSMADQRGVGLRHLQQLFERVRYEFPTLAVLTEMAVVRDFPSVDALFVAIGVAELDVLEVFADVVARTAVVQLALIDGDASAGDAADGDASSGGVFAPTSARLSVVARDREGLLRDVAMLLSRHDVGILSSSARTDPSRDSSIIELEVPTRDFVALARILDLLADLPGVTQTRRDLE